MLRAIAFSSQIDSVSATLKNSSGEEFVEVECTVSNGGELGSVKGVNIPNTTLQLPSMTEKDKEDILWAVKLNEVDIGERRAERGDEGGGIRDVLTPPISFSRQLRPPSSVRPGT